MQDFLGAHHHVMQFLLQAVRICVVLVILTVVFAPLERFFSIRKAKLFYRNWPVDLGWYFLDGLATTFLLGPPVALIAWAVHAAVPSAVTGWAAGLPIWWRMAGAMVVGEVGFYWGHRWSHEFPFLWRFHAIHHSAEHVGFLVNTRAHPIDMIFTRLCGLALLYATGFASPVPLNGGSLGGDIVPVLVLLVGSFWSYFIHANIRVRLGFLEEIISTPAFHHWHHTREDHKDRNYSSMVPVIDRIFGTFYLPRHWPEEYGADTPMPPSVTGQLLQPFAPASRRETPAPGSSTI
jgi:sterol desaturase/sphingolipid hydroxylase (fatty acid hydroxylase superfamily)